MTPSVVLKNIMLFLHDFYARRPLFRLSTNAQKGQQSASRWRGVLSLMPNRPVTDQWESPRKMEWHFPIKPSQPIGMTLVISNSFSEFPNGLSKMERGISVWIFRPKLASGPPPEVIPNIQVRRNRNGPFHLSTDQNFRNLWCNRKHPKWPASSGLDSSVCRVLHRYHRSHGFESRSGLNIFQALISQLLCI